MNLNHSHHRYRTKVTPWQDQKRSKSVLCQVIREKSWRISFLARLNLQPKIKIEYFVADDSTETSVGTMLKLTFLRNSNWILCSLCWIHVAVFVLWGTTKLLSLDNGSKMLVSKKCLPVKIICVEFDCVRYWIIVQKHSSWYVTEYVC